MAHYECTRGCPGFWLTEWERDEHVRESHPPMDARATIERIAEISKTVAQQAGVGGMETAGQIVSYLAAHPEHIDGLLANGIWDLPPDWFENGCLTWHGMNGKIVHPQEVRLRRVVKNMAKTKPA